LLFLSEIGSFLDEICLSQQKNSALLQQLPKQIDRYHLLFTDQGLLLAFEKTERQQQIISAESFADSGLMIHIKKEIIKIQLLGFNRTFNVLSLPL
jgi:hypothetical protein